MEAKPMGDKDIDRYPLGRYMSLGAMGGSTWREWAKRKGLAVLA